MKKDMIVLLIACAVGMGVGAVWAAMPELTKEVEGFQNREEAIALDDFLSFKKENIKDAMVLGRGGTNVLEKSGEVAVKTGKGVVRFFPVDGASNLPREFLDGREITSPTNTCSVVIDRFWISEKMVTEGEFASLMGRKIPEGRSENDVAVNFEWEDALEYCRRFTVKYADQLPQGCYASIPMAIEWAHTMKLLGEKTKNGMHRDCGTFLFAMTHKFSVLHTYDTSCNDDFKLATHALTLPKRCKSSEVGLRMVLINIGGGQVKIDNAKIPNSQYIRGCILNACYLRKYAKGLLGALLQKGRLDEAEQQDAQEAYLLKNVDGMDEYHYEDWSGMVAFGGKIADEMGYKTEPFISGWQMMSYWEPKSDDVVAAYEKAGIEGEWVRIGDLPREVQREQFLLGEKESCSCYFGKEMVDLELPVTPDVRVQVLKCDFSGDGRKDMIVEQYGSVGSGGYCYDFYKSLSDGSYTNVLSLQTVGLCALPKKDGTGCGFLCVYKDSNPILSMSLLSFKGFKDGLEKIKGNANYEFAKSEDGVYDSISFIKNFCMLDAAEDRIYLPAPFIGAGYGLGWRYLQYQNHWYRPLYWPWKKGEIRGFEEARRKFKEKGGGDSVQ